MARSKTEIKQQMTESFISNEWIVNMYGIDPDQSFENQFSLVSFENILFELLAISYFILETLFDAHKSEVSAALSELKPHTARWYRNKALAFQYGFALVAETDIFNNAGKTDEEVQNSKIIKYSAVTEAQTESRLIIKIATEKDAELQPISDEQKTAFDAYIQEIKDAGVKITVINYLPDVLELKMQIYYDPLVLTSDGTSIQTAKKPVEIALKEFLKELPFNGELILQSLVDRLQTTEGVKIVNITGAASKWIDPDLGGYGDFENIGISKIPVSGYFKIENFNIEYIAR